MRKIFCLFALLISCIDMFLWGCTNKDAKTPSHERKHVYRTYYCDIDVDTFKDVGYDVDGDTVYLVHETYREDTCYGYLNHGETIVVNVPIKHYYIPKKNIYWESFPDNQGREVVVEFNPYTNSYE